MADFAPHCMFVSRISTITDQSADIDSPANRHSNDVSLAGRYYMYVTLFNLLTGSLFREIRNVFAYMKIDHVIISTAILLQSTCYRLVKLACVPVWSFFFVSWSIMTISSEIINGLRVKFLLPQ